VRGGGGDAGRAADGGEDRMIYGAVYAALLSAGGLTAGIRPSRHALYYLALAFLFLFVGYRYQVGCDWGGYLVIYDSTALLELGDALRGHEPLFLAANVLLHRWELGYEYINVAAALVYFYGFHRIAVRQPDRLGFLILSFPIVVLHLPMSGIRQAMALGVLCLAYGAFIDRRPLRYVLFVVIAGGFHTSALAFLAMTPFMFGQLTWKKAVLCALIAAPILYLVGGGADFEMYAERYMGSGPDAAGAPFRTGALALVGGIFLLLLREQWRRQSPADYNLMLIGSVLMIAAFPLALSASVIGDRIGYYFTIFQMIILARIPYMIRSPAIHPAPYLAVGAMLMVWIQFSHLFDRCYMPYSNLLLF
jgi:hypothetical protein